MRKKRAVAGADQDHDVLAMRAKKVLRTRSLKPPPEKNTAVSGT